MEVLSAIDPVSLAGNAALRLGAAAEAGDEQAKRELGHLEREAAMEQSPGKSFLDSFPRLIFHPSEYVPEGTIPELANCALAYQWPNGSITFDPEPKDKARRMKFPDVEMLQYWPVVPAYIQPQDAGKPSGWETFAAMKRCTYLRAAQVERMVKVAGEALRKEMRALGGNI